LHHFYRMASLKERKWSSAPSGTSPRAAARTAIRRTESPGTDAPPAEIRVEDLHKSFDGHPVLRGVDLEIRRGELVAIVGASGSGKTVLLKHLIGHEHPDRGRVLLADHEAPDAPLVDLASLDDEAMDRLRRHWAVVFQKNALFTGTVYDNIALGLFDVKGMEPQQARQRAREMLQAVGLDPDEVLDRDRDDLSGGMAKRVAVARALALEPILMFYDEPTTGLDPELGEKIHNLIRTVHLKPAEGGSPRTSVIITHDTALLSRLEPRVVMLHDGTVFFDGSARDFAQSDSPITRPYIEVMPMLHCLGGEERRKR
jgi:phospholipid/cholesterol/gamma-HCH transport system ATP-binding protein